MKWVVRIVGVVVAVLAISIIGLWLASNRRDAGRMRGSVEIDRPTDEVFAWITRPDKLEQWVNYLSDVQDDPSTPQEGIGHREIWVMDDPRRQAKVSVPGTITVWDPPQQMGVHVEAADYVADVFYQLSDIGGGRTRFDEDARVHYNGRLGTLLEPVTTPDAMHKMYDDMQRLKRKLEAQPFPADSVGAADTTGGASAN